MSSDLEPLSEIPKDDLRRADGRGAESGVVGARERNVRREEAVGGGEESPLGERGWRGVGGYCK